MSIGIEKYLLTVAQAVAVRSTCRRKVGCVLADARGKILATGYNGPPSGVKHCDDRGCDLQQANSTTCQGKSPGCACSIVPGSCDAIHAEQNALIQCPDVSLVHYAAVTRAPCVPCTRLLLNSGTSVVLFNEDSSHPDAMRYFLHARANKKMAASWLLIDL